MPGELTRLVPLSRIGAAGLSFMVRASVAECAAIATRMDLFAIASLHCTFDLTVDGDGVSVTAHGRLNARVTRTCVISAEDFETDVDDRFDVHFVPAGTERDDPDPDLPDEIPYEGGSIDLGEATAEQLALVLDPYPRLQGAELPDSETGENPSPFAVLGLPGPDKIRH